MTFTKKARRLFLPSFNLLHIIPTSLRWAQPQLEVLPLNIIGRNNRRQQSGVNFHTEQLWFKAILQCAWLQNECSGKTAASPVWLKEPTIWKVSAYFQVIFRFLCLKYVAMLTLLACFQGSRVVIWRHVWYNKHISDASVIRILKENKSIKVASRVFPQAKTAGSVRRAQSCGDAGIFFSSIICCPILCHKFRRPLGWMWKEPHYNPSQRYSWNGGICIQSQRVFTIKEECRKASRLSFI